MRLFTLIIHMCLLSTVGCFIPFPSGGIYLPGFGVVGALYHTLHLLYHMIAMPQPQNMLLPLSPWHKNLTMMSQFWRHFRPTHANCHASANRAQPALSANAWQLAQVGQNGR